MTDKLVCPVCGRAYTKDEWTASSVKFAESYGDPSMSYPNDWHVENADPGDSVMCPNEDCRQEEELSQLAEDTNVFVMDMGEYETGIMSTDGTVVDLLPYGAEGMSNYLRGKRVAEVKCEDTKIVIKFASEEGQTDVSKC